MKLIVISVAYERPIPLRILIDCFIIQTDQRWKLSVIYDGPVPKDVQKVMDLYAKNDKIVFYRSKERLGNYGHPNRKQVLDRLPGDDDDYVLMTNDDNYYVPVYIESMLSKCNNGVGIVSCNTVHSHFQYKVHESLLKCGRIDMGAFIVRYPIAKEVGFNHIDFAADGHYAEECAEACRLNRLQTIHIPKPLFIHN